MTREVKAKEERCKELRLAEGRCTALCQTMTEVLAMNKMLKSKLAQHNIEVGEKHEDECGGRISARYFRNVP